MPPRQDPNTRDMAHMRQQLDTLIAEIAVMRTQHTTKINRLQAQLETEHRQHQPRNPDPRREHRNRDPSLGSTTEDDIISLENLFAAFNRRDDNRGNHDHRWESGFKLDLPKFNGGSEAADYLV